MDTSGSTQKNGMSTDGSPGGATESAPLSSPSNGLFDDLARFMSSDFHGASLEEVKGPLSAFCNGDPSKLWELAEERCNEGACGNACCGKRFGSRVRLMRKMELSGGEEGTDRQRKFMCCLDCWKRWKVLEGAIRKDFEDGKRAGTAVQKASVVSGRENCGGGSSSSAPSALSRAAVPKKRPQLRGILKKKGSSTSPKGSDASDKSSGSGGANAGSASLDPQPLKSSKDILGLVDKVRADLKSLGIGSPRDVDAPLKKIASESQSEYKSESKPKAAADATTSTNAKSAKKAANSRGKTKGWSGPTMKDIVVEKPMPASLPPSPTFPQAGSAKTVIEGHEVKMDHLDFDVVAKSAWNGENDDGGNKSDEKATMSLAESIAEGAGGNADDWHDEQLAGEEQEDVSLPFQMRDCFFSGSDDDDDENDTDYDDDDDDDNDGDINSDTASEDDCDPANQHSNPLERTFLKIFTLLQEWITSFSGEYIKAARLDPQAVPQSMPLATDMEMSRCLGLGKTLKMNLGNSLDVYATQGNSSEDSVKLQRRLDCLLKTFSYRMATPKLSKDEWKIFVCLLIECLEDSRSSEEYTPTKVVLDLLEGACVTGGMSEGQFSHLRRVLLMFSGLESASRESPP